MTPDLTGGPRRRGRPRTAGDAHCDRCGRSAGKLRTCWPEGGICGTCFHTAVRTTGTCPRCNHHGMLPGLDGDQPICRHCADIPTDLDCHRCGTEAEHYRRGGICARCALRDDLTALLAPRDARVQPKLRELVEVLCAVDRPESIHTWKRRPAVQTMLASLGDGSVELTHDALDSADSGGKTAEHLRDLLVHHGLLPHRDRDLARFQTWLDVRLGTTGPAWARRILERYGRWHHIPAIRRHLARGGRAQARVHLAKQEITEVGRLLAWLHEHDTTLADCTQAQLDRWITTGPSTRSLIRPFLAWARHHRLAPTDVELARRHARTTPTVTDETRFGWLRRCLVGEADTLAYRVAAVLLLLYAQPLVRVASLRRDRDPRDPGRVGPAARRRTRRGPSPVLRAPGAAPGAPAQRAHDERREPVAVPGRSSRAAPPPQHHAHPAPRPRDRPARKPEQRTARSRRASPRPNRRQPARLCRGHHAAPRRAGRAARGELRRATRRPLIRRRGASGRPSGLGRSTQSGTSATNGHVIETSSTLNYMDDAPLHSNECSHAESVTLNGRYHGRPPRATTSWAPRRRVGWPHALPRVYSLG